MNDLTPNEYRKLLFLVTHADEEVIKLKVWDNQQKANAKRFVEEL